VYKNFTGLRNLESFSEEKNWCTKTLPVCETSKVFPKKKFVYKNFTGLRNFKSFSDDKKLCTKTLPVCETSKVFPMKKICVQKLYRFAKP
jgi:hypothetical protein